VNLLEASTKSDLLIQLLDLLRGNLLTMNRSAISVRSFVICIPSVNKISNGYNYHSDYQRTEKVNDNGGDYDENCYYCYI
jgi:hypothetical protein